MAEILAILGLVATPVTEAGKALVGIIKRQTSYLLCYRSNVENLNKEIENLGRTRNDVQGKVDADSRNGQVITEVVQKWLKDVEDVKEDAMSLDDQVKENISCFNLRSRYRLGKEAKKKMDDVCTLQTKVKSINIVSYPPQPPTIESLPARGFMPLESTEFSMYQVMDALKDDNINMIGVYGMGGVGKTTLMKQVARKVKSEELFQEAIVVTLTQKLELKTIQGEIGEQLGLELKEESQIVRAGKLSERLKQEMKTKKILLIFDNLWERLELDDVGIPSEWNDRGCKIAFTTRSVEVCGDMDSQVKIPINVLSDEDAWNLFKGKVGNAIDSPALNDVARSVAKECGGLPLAIVTLGRALRDKDQTVWNHVLLQLQRSNPTNVKDMNGKVFSSLEMSYNYLESKEAQSCFLFCCLFPEGWSISMDDMMKYGIGEGLFEDVSSIEEAMDRVHMLFDKLKASCLLLEGDVQMSVKMHDVVRDVALSITSRAEHGFFVKSNVGLKEWPEIGNVHERKRISLAYNEISQLPDPIECPRLLTLVLEKNCSLKEIPNGFFQGMDSLKVLDIRHTNISMLPPALEGLKNLRTLWLDGCSRLEDATIIGGLKKLEVLCLKCTGICKLTEKMGELHNLKLLDLTQTYSLEMVAPDVISRMTCLEELHMGKSFSKWEVMGNGDARQASLAEIASLSRLTALYIHVENVKCLSLDIPGPWKNLKKFRICVGGDYTVGDVERSIKIENSPSPIANWVEVLFNRTYELELVCCKGLDILMQSHKLSFNNLAILFIEECGEMEHFVSMKEEEPPRNVFAHLKKLHLSRLKNLKTLCQGTLLASSLQNLRKLILFGCNKLMNIMPSDLPQSLEELYISHCDELVEVFHFQETSKEDAPLSKLRKLELYDLSELARIWKGVEPPIGSLHHLEELHVKYCERVRYLLSPTLAQRLQQLKLLHVWCCEKMEILIGAEVEESTAASGSRQSELMFPPHSLPQGRMFPNLRELSIGFCHNFRNLFSLTVAEGLLQLKELYVFRCERVEAIISKEADEEVADQRMLPSLRILHLDGLEQLTSFYEGVGVLFDWPSLEYINVRSCKNFKKIQMGPHSAPNLKKISSSKEWLEEVEWEDESLKARIQPLIHLVEY